MPQIQMDHLLACFAPIACSPVWPVQPGSAMAVMFAVCPGFFVILLVAHCMLSLASLLCTGQDLHVTALAVAWQDC